ncbi:hypothetical protein JCM10207_001531 [Rhodosporidiobolus poonsookiae]
MVSPLEATSPSAAGPFLVGGCLQLLICGYALSTFQSFATTQSWRKTNPAVRLLSGFVAIMVALFSGMVISGVYNVGTRAPSERGSLPAGLASEAVGPLLEGATAALSQAILVGRSGKVITRQPLRLAYFAVSAPLILLALVANVGRSVWAFALDDHINLGRNFPSAAGCAIVALWVTAAVDAAVVVCLAIRLHGLRHNFSLTTANLPLVLWTVVFGTNASTAMFSLAAAIAATTAFAGSTPVAAAFSVPLSALYLLSLTTTRTHYITSLSAPSPENVALALPPAFNAPPVPISFSSVARLGHSRGSSIERKPHNLSSLAAPPEVRRLNSLMSLPTLANAGETPSSPPLPSPPSAGSWTPSPPSSPTFGDCTTPLPAPAADAPLPALPRSARSSFSLVRTPSTTSLANPHRRSSSLSSPLDFLRPLHRPGTPPPPVPPLPASPGAGVGVPSALPGVAVQVEVSLQVSEERMSDQEDDEGGFMAEVEKVKERKLRVHQGRASPGVREALSRKEVASGGARGIRR